MTDTEARVLAAIALRVNRLRIVLDIVDPWVIHTVETLAKRHSKAQRQWP
jgi:hypothetical protein